MPGSAGASASACKSHLSSTGISINLATVRVTQKCPLHRVGNQSVPPWKHPSTAKVVLVASWTQPLCQPGRFAEDTFVPVGECSRHIPSAQRHILPLSYSIHHHHNLELHSQKSNVSNIPRRYALQYIEGRAVCHYSSHYSIQTALSLQSL